MTQPEPYALLLDACVARLRQGEAVAACLADHPAQAADLAPDLALSADLLQLSPLAPSPAAADRGLQQMMAALDLGANPASPPGWKGWLARPRPRPGPSAGPWLRLALVSLLLLFAVGSLTINASAGSLPGDLLYPVKRSWEDTRLALTLDETARQAFRSQLDRQRRAEVRAVLQRRQAAVVEFQGRLDSAGSDEWRVEGLPVYISQETSFAGTWRVGQEVAVRAQARADGTLVGLLLKGLADPAAAPAVPTLELRPQASPQPAGERPTATQTALPTPEPTRPSVTVPVREATAMPTATPNSIDAIRVTATSEPRLTAEPTASREPTSTRWAEPTSTPALDLAVTSTARPSPTQAPTRAATVTPDTDVRPTAEPTRADAPALTREPEPTSTPVLDARPTATPHPTRTPAPQDPTPTSRPANDLHPEPTATPVPNRDLAPTAEPAATRADDSGTSADRPP